MDLGFGSAEMKCRFAVVTKLSMRLLYFSNLLCQDLKFISKRSKSSVTLSIKRLLHSSHCICMTFFHNCFRAVDNKQCKKKFQPYSSRQAICEVLHYDLTCFPEQCDAIMPICIHVADYENMSCLNKLNPAKGTLFLKH